MTRCYSVGSIKKIGRKRQVKPSPGSLLREAYDILNRTPGEPVTIKMTAFGSRSADDLRDYYGMDIREVGKCRWVLAGEWDGNVYIDHIAARIDASPSLTSEQVAR